MILLQVDIDNLWMYEQEYGVAIHPDKELVYSHSLPILLSILKQTGSKATFMLTGKDLKLKACRNFCLKAYKEGHEIANHSWSHPTRFHQLNQAQKKAEITNNHQEITRLLKAEPVGYRGPGYYIDSECVAVLQQLKYHYDASILPGYAQLLMRAFSYLKGGENRHKAFGRFQDIFSPAKPYYINRQKKLRELPISVLPWCRLPISTTFAYTFGPVYRRLIFNYLASKPDYLLYLFHAIDFTQLPQKPAGFPVVTLHYSFEQRLSLSKKIIETLILANGGPLVTAAKASRR